MKLEFNIGNIGSFVASFESDQHKVKIRHSAYYGDKFQELLNELFLIYNSKQNGEESFFPYTSEVFWYDDCVNYSWQISAASSSSEIRIEIYKISPVDNTYKINLLKHNFRFNDLFDAIYASLEKILKDFGFIGYKINWEAGNFPIYEYLKLKSDKYGLELRKEDVDEDDEWKNRMLVENELMIISERLQ